MIARALLEKAPINVMTLANCGMLTARTTEKKEKKRNVRN